MMDRLSFIRLGYFFLFFSFGCISPYFALLFDSKGFSPSMIGVLNGVSPLCTLCVVPVVAYFADTRDIQSEVMYVTIVGSSALMFVMCFTDEKTTVGVAAVCYYLVKSSLPSLYDEHSLTVIGRENKAAYGESRVFGAYAWAMSATLSSLVFGHIGWKLIAVIYTLGQCGHAFAISQTTVKRTPGDHHYLEILDHIRRRPRLILFLVGVTMMGVGYSIIASFLFLFLQDELGAPPILLGLCIVFTVVIEIPLFRNSTWIHSKFSDSQLFLMGLGCWILRGFGYSFLSNPWFVLALEPLHGGTFGLMWLSGLSVLTNAFPATLSNTAIGVLHATSFGLGPLIGNLVGGHLYDEFGPRKMFRGFALVLTCFGVVYWWLDSAFEAAEKAAEGEKNNKTQQQKDDHVVVCAGRPREEDARHSEADCDLARCVAE